MRKHLKVQKSASVDSKLGRRWETVFLNLLRARDITALPRQTITGFEHEADLYIPADKNVKECVISVAHVKQRNPKEKFYRLLDELSLFKTVYPSTRKVLVYIGDFLATKGWRDILEELFDEFVFLNGYSCASRLIEVAEMGEELAHGPLTAIETRRIVQNLKCQDLCDDLKNAILSSAKEQQLWQTHGKEVQKRKKLLEKERDQIIRTKQQTQIRRPLLTAICIPPKYREMMSKNKRGSLKLAKGEGQIQARLGTLNVHRSIVGSLASPDSKVAELLESSGNLVATYEQSVRTSNPIYAAYLDDLHNPSRIEEIVDKFRKEIASSTLTPSLVRQVLLRCRNNQIALTHNRPSIWAMEICLAHSGLSRNELDKRLSKMSPSTFPNARNVTGRYIYRELRDTKSLSLDQYEKAASEIFKGVKLLSDSDAVDYLIEDRRYAVAVIQNPKPLESMLVASVKQVFPVHMVVERPSEPTLVNLLFREITGKAPGRLGIVPFQFAIKGSKGRILLRALSGFDRANINHKLKELSAKISLLRLAELKRGIRPSICVCILDGEWSSDDQNALYIAGYDYLCSIPELQELLNELAAQIGA